MKASSRTRAIIIAVLVACLLVPSLVFVIGDLRDRQLAQQVEASQRKAGEEVSQTHGAGETFTLVGAPDPLESSDAPTIEGVGIEGREPVLTYLNTLGWVGPMDLKVNLVGTFDDSGAAGLSQSECLDPDYERFAKGKGYKLVVYSIWLRNSGARPRTSLVTPEQEEKYWFPCDFFLRVGTAYIGDVSYFDGTPEGAGVDQALWYELAPGEEKTIRRGSGRPSPRETSSSRSLGQRNRAGRAARARSSWGVLDASQLWEIAHM